MKILVADDYDLVRETIAAFLLGEGASTVATAATLNEAIRVMSAQHFDLALLDAEMPSMNGLTGLGMAIRGSNGARVAIMSGRASRELAEATIGAGGIGFVPKKMTSYAMAAAVRRMAKGGVFAPIAMLHNDQMANTPLASLTEREFSVLRGICEGNSNKEIARTLDLQEVTIKLHVKTLMSKLQAKNRTHAAMIARNGGLQ